MAQMKVYYLHEREDWNRPVSISLCPQTDEDHRVCDLIFKNHESDIYGFGRDPRTGKFAHIDIAVVHCPPR